VFSNFIPFRRQILQIGLEGKNHVTIDLSQTHLVDHTVMEQLHELESVFDQQGLTLRVIGLESHRAFSDHPLSTRKRRGTEIVAATRTNR